MIDKELNQEVEAWIAVHRDEMIQDILTLVRVKSVAEHDAVVKPYGQGCRDALDAMLAMAERYGFAVKNHENTIGEIDFGGSGQDIGFWGHLDVVPEGDNWEYPPYEGVVKNGLIIGRGAQDNKGQTVAVLYVMRCLKELHIPLQHNLKLFVGTDEECGMNDITWFLSNHTAPPFSIIADSNFPVCYGEKGIITADLSSQMKLSGDVLSLSGGVAANVVPSCAQALLKNTDRASAAVSKLRETLTVTQEGGGLLLVAHGSSGHTAFPQGSVNAVYMLTKALCESGALGAADTDILSFCNIVNRDYLGAGLDIAGHDEMSGDLTCVGSILQMTDGVPTLTVNIRYPVSGDAQQVLDTMQNTCVHNGWQSFPQRVDKAHYFPKEHPVVDTLTQIYNEMTGDHKEPFVLSGGTYSRKLKHSISFGMGFSGDIARHAQSEGMFGPGHGGAHGPDEAAVILQLTTSIAIFVHGLLAIDGLELE